MLGRCAMTLLRRRFFHAAAGAVALLATSLGAAAQSFPARPVTMIVPFPAAGPADVLARVLNDRMRGSLGQSVIVGNVRGGAGDNPGGPRGAPTPPRATRVLRKTRPHRLHSGLLHP